MEAAQARYKSNADKHRLHTMFEAGQPVLLSTKHMASRFHGSRKLTPRWIGPFEIKDKVSDLACKLVLPDHFKMHDVFHISLLLEAISTIRAKYDAAPTSADRRSAGVRSRSGVRPQRCKKRANETKGVPDTMAWLWS
jgi:hypothetical protein